MADRNVVATLSLLMASTIQSLLVAVVRSRALRRRALFMRRVAEYCARMRRAHLMRVAAFNRERRPKRMWRRARSTDWWDRIVPGFTDEEFVENFRMRRRTYEYICDRLRHRLEPQHNPINGAQGLSVEKVVAIAIYKMASLTEYRQVGNQFGVHKSTVHNCLYAFCIAVNDELGAEHIRMPDEAEATIIANQFEAITNIPQIIGAIDGSHIPITGPETGRADFTNRKGYCSFVLQALVDCQYLFRNISIKMPGCAHDAHVFRESELFKNREELMPKGVKEVDGMRIPFFIVGDPAYPLLPWVIKNYSYDGRTTREMDSFNCHMNQGRIVVENAFGRLKARWRILLRQSEIHYTFIPQLVATCCILHNIIERNRDNFNLLWDQEIANEAGIPPQPDLEAYEEENEPDGADLRHHLTRYLARNFELRRSIRWHYAGV